MYKSVFPLLLLLRLRIGHVSVAGWMRANALGNGEIPESGREVDCCLTKLCDDIRIVKGDILHRG